jgi:hypothetical protein
MAFLFDKKTVEGLSTGLIFGVFFIPNITYDAIEVDFQYHLLLRFGIGTIFS